MTSWQAWKGRFCTALVVGAFSSQVAYADAVLSFSASPNPAVQGSPVALDVLVSGAVDLYAYQFSLAFNPAVLQVSSVTEGSFLGTGGTTFFDGGNVNNATGSLSFVFDTLLGALPGVSGNGVLARITFNVASAGTSTLTWSNVLMLDSALTTMAVTAQTGTLLALPVPEPATMLLFGLGLAGVAGLTTAKRRQAQQAQ